MPSALTDATRLRYTLIVACARNRVIGCNGAMPWHLPEDLQFFKRATMGKAMIMGSNTFQSLPYILPGRYHIVLSSHTIDPHTRVKQVASLEEAQAQAQACVQEQQLSHEIMVIGGAQIYTQWLAQANRILMTQIDENIEGDTFFPQFTQEQWTCVTQPWNRSSSGITYRFTEWHKQA